MNDTLTLDIRGELFTQQTTMHDKYAKTFHITRTSLSNGIVDVSIIHDGLDIFLPNLSRNDALSMAAIFTDIAEGVL